MRAAAAGVFSAAILASAPSFALGADDGLLHQGDSVRASLAHGERKTIAFAGVAGASIDLRAAAVHGGRAAPRVTLLNPAGTAVTAGDAEPGSGHVARIDGYVLPSTGVWRITLESPTPGDVTLTSRAAAPLHLWWTGAGAADRTFDAASGGRVSVVITTGGEASLQLLSPTGELLEEALARDGRAVIRRAALPQLGRYTIRVAGAVTEFTADAVVRPAAPRRRRFRAVESPPDVRGFAPGSAPNQSLFTLGLDGTGF